MGLGPPALPPAGYVAFCKRQPLDCGADPQRVLAGARQAAADRTALLAALAARAHGRGLALPAALKVRLQARAGDAAASERWPALTPGLWATLNAVNATVNRAIVQQTDARTYGLADYWATPLENGRHEGDCEDFVLEKERALIAAGVPRRALDIALVTTPSGEDHAVLLVDAGKDELVLDDLTPWIKPWRDTRYLWRQRQVDGEPFRWAAIEDPRLARAVSELVARRAAAEARARTRPLIVARR